MIVFSEVLHHSGGCEPVRDCEPVRGCEPGTVARDLVMFRTTRKLLTSTALTRTAASKLNRRGRCFLPGVCTGVGNNVTSLIYEVLSLCCLRVETINVGDGWSLPVCRLTNLAQPCSSQS